MGKSKVIVISILTFLIAGMVYAQLGGSGSQLGTSMPIAREEDGDPSGHFSKIIFDNGTLVKNTAHVHVSTRAGALIATGWQDDGTTVRLVTLTDNVGIGTTAPGAELHVKVASGSANFHLDAAATGDSVIRLQEAGTSTQAIYAANGVANNPLYFYDYASGGIAMAINNGNVGIGVTDPDTPLEVFNAGTQLKLSYDADSFATFSLDASDDLTIKPAASGGVRFQPTTTDTTDFFQVLDQDGGTPVLNVDATNERVGIGDTAPVEELTLNGDFTQYDGNPWHAFEDTGTNTGYMLHWESGDTYPFGLWGVDFSSHVPSVNPNTPIWWINSSHDFIVSGDKYEDSAGLIVKRATGNVGIGTTAPEGNLHIFEGSAGNVIASTAANTLVMESDDHSGFSFLNPNDKSGSIYFGDEDDNDVGSIAYSHGNNVMTFVTNTAARLELQNTQTLLNSPNNDVNFVIEGTSGVYLHADAGTERVGIGTTGPGSLLHVEKNTISGSLGVAPTIEVSNPSTATHSFSFYELNANNADTEANWTVDGLGTGAIMGTSGSYIGTSSNHPFALVTNNSAKLWVKEDGNVGIGTTGPEGDLHITSTATPAITEFNNPILVLEDDQGIGDWGPILHFQGDGDNVPAIIFGSDTDNDAGQIRYNLDGVSTAPANMMRFFTAGTEQMVIDNSGNVGIGTTGPDARLHSVSPGFIGGGEYSPIILGNIDFTAGMLTNLRWQAGTDGVNERDSAAIKVEQNDADSAIMSFWLDEAGLQQRMTILNSGNVGIGTTAPVEELDVTGDIRATGLASATHVEVTANLSAVHVEVTAAATFYGDAIFRDSGSGFPYGCMEGMDEAISCDVDDTWYQITFDTAGASNLVTIDVDNEEMTVTHAGVYQISLVGCFSSAQGHDFELMVKTTDGTVDKAPHLFQSTPVAAQVENVAGTCLITLSAGERVEAWVRQTDAGGQTATFEHVSVALVMVGG